MSTDYVPASARRSDSDATWAGQNHMNADQHESSLGSVFPRAKRTFGNRSLVVGQPVVV
jgi:hypothetical protein